MYIGQTESSEYKQKFTRRRWTCQLFLYNFRSKMENYSVTNLTNGVKKLSALGQCRNIVAKLMKYLTNAKMLEMILRMCKFSIHFVKICFFQFTNQKFFTRIFRAEKNIKIASCLYDEGQKV